MSAQIAVEDDEDDVPRLSAEALSALKEFYAEEEARKAPQNIEEDWQLSQFWYDEDTSKHLAKKAMEAAGGGSVACLSCPSVFRAMKDIAQDGLNAKLLEYDRRFDIYSPDFVPYDYNSPQDLPAELKGSFDVVVADPPFLSEECLTKTAVAIRYICRADSSAGPAKIILCTGAVMEELAAKLLKVTKRKFQPTHSRNLANNFACYTNYEFD